MLKLSSAQIKFLPVVFLWPPNQLEQRPKLRMLSEAIGFWYIEILQKVYESIESMVKVHVDWGYRPIKQAVEPRSEGTWKLLISGFGGDWF